MHPMHLSPACRTLRGYQNQLEQARYDLASSRSGMGAWE
jgi:hypothetical protein